MPRSRCAGESVTNRSGASTDGQDVAAAAAADQDLAAAVFGAFEQRGRADAARMQRRPAAAPAPIRPQKARHQTPGPQKAQTSPPGPQKAQKAQTYITVLSRAQAARRRRVHREIGVGVCRPRRRDRGRAAGRREPAVEISDTDIPDAKQPYHAGFGTARDAGDELKRLVASVKSTAANRSARRSKNFARPAILRGRRVVVGSLIDPKTIGNDHIRIHAMEGQLFRGVVIEAAEKSGFEV